MNIKDRLISLHETNPPATSVLLEAVQKIDSLEGLIWQAAGWVWTEACIRQAKGESIDRVEIPDIIERMKKEIPELRTK